MLLNQAGFKCPRFAFRSFSGQLLVMGAYGHSRFRELVLGGATKYVLEHAQLPVLFMH